MFFSRPRKLNVAERLNTRWDRPVTGRTRGAFLVGVVRERPATIVQSRRLSALAASLRAVREPPYKETVPNRRAFFEVRYLCAMNSEAAMLSPIPTTIHRTVLRERRRAMSAPP